MNYFNIDELKVISIWGKETKPLHSSVCTNLAPNLGWTMLTETNKGTLAVGEEATIELDLATVPTSKRPEEFNQEEDVETVDNQFGNRETGQNTGRVRIVQMQFYLCQIQNQWVLLET